MTPKEKAWEYYIQGMDYVKACNKAGYDLYQEQKDDVFDWSVYAVIAGLALLAYYAW